MGNDQIIPIRRNLITGMNTKGHGTLIGTNQAVLLENFDLVQPGRTKKRGGYTEQFDAGASKIQNAIRFNPNGGSDKVAIIEATNLKHWDSTAGLSSAIKSDLTTDLYTLLISGNDLLLVSNGTDNVHTFNSSFTETDELDTDTDPPKGVVGTYFRNRFLIAKDSILYYSNVATTPGTLPAWSRSTQFLPINEGDNDDITNLIPWRNNQIIVFKEGSIWVLDVSDTTPGNWVLTAVEREYGCVSKQAAVQVGDDIYFWARDGARTLRHNEQDSLIGISVPISDPIETNYVDNINFAQIGLIRAVYFKNRVIFCVPFDESTIPNYWFVYHLQADPQYNGWSVWKEIDTSCFVKWVDAGQEKLYFGDGNADGKFYEMFDGNNDNGTIITCKEQGRIEDYAEHGAESNKKEGQSLLIKCETSTLDNAEISVSAQADEGGYFDLGTLSLKSNAPTLPVDLPFNLIESSVTYGKFPLNALEHWYTFEYQIEQTGTNMDVSILERMLISTIDDYEYEV